MNSFTVLWESALKKLENYYTLNNNYLGFSNYVTKLTPEFEESGKFFFKVPSNFYKEQIEERFYPQIQKALQDSYRDTFGQEKPLDIQVLTTSELDQLVVKTPAPVQNTGGNIFLNPNYTFETFVVGKSNNLAHAASLAVATTPGLAYNPLFIYGGVGLGKTHLMHAIGNRILESNPSAKIIYITTEAFTNEFIESIQKHNTESFRNKFRKVDVLLIDDIQFISKTRETQEELFHTFNTLREGNKQIILSSDKPPAEIPRLEERLLSRFQWGLLTDIGLPDYETRVAILKNKAPYIKELIRCTLPIEDDVLDYIATKEDANIRDLEGALKKVIASAQLDSTLSSITLDVATSALDTFFTPPTVKNITPQLILKRVCEYYEVTEEDILSKKKNREIAFPRQVAMYLIKTLTDATNQRICDYVGLSNHTTVIYACDKIKKMAAQDSEMEMVLSDITKRIRE